MAVPFRGCGCRPARAGKTFPARRGCRASRPASCRVRRRGGLVVHELCQAGQQLDHGEHGLLQMLHVGFEPSEPALELLLGHSRAPPIRSVFACTTNPATGSALFNDEILALIGVSIPAVNACASYLN